MGEEFCIKDEMTSEMQKWIRTGSNDGGQFFLRG